MTINRKWYAEDIAEIIEDIAMHNDMRMTAFKCGITYTNLKKIVSKAKLGGFSAFPKRGEL